MKVYYGFSKLTEKVVRKVELAVYFENSSHNPSKLENWVAKRMHVIHSRIQTKEESVDADVSNREFTKYQYFIDEKPYYGNIDKVLYQNFVADENHVSIEERELIREKLRKVYFKLFNGKEDNQLTLKF